MRRGLWIALVLLSALVLVAALAPARLVLDRLTVPGLQLGAVTGTVWRGGVDDVRYHKVALGNLRWRLRPAALLRLAWVVEVDASGGWGTANAVFGRRGDDLTIERLNGRVDARLLGGRFATPEIIPLGNLEIADFALAWQGHAVTRLAGNVRWPDAALAGLVRANLGDLRADLQWDAPNVGRVVLSDAGGPLAMQGTVWLSLLGWRGDVALAARDPALAPGLEWIGRAEADGSRRLLLQGAWVPLP